MSLPLTIPILNNPKTTKDRVFVILSAKYPLSLTQLRNQIINSFDGSVSFQSVRKAVLQLVDEGVLVKDGKKFSFSKDWIISFIKFGNILQKHYFSANKSRSKIEIGSDVTEYNLDSLLDLDFIWNGLIKKALEEEVAPKIITFKATHFWFLISTLAQETELIKSLLKKGVKLYYICYGKTALDEWTVNMYRQIGIHCIRKDRPKSFPEGLNIGTYGDYLIQSLHPDKITKRISRFFKSCKSPQDASLTEITSIVTQKADFKLQSIHNPLVAKGVREEIIREIKNLLEVSLLEKKCARRKVD